MKTRSLGAMLRDTAAQWPDKPAMQYGVKGEFHDLSYNGLVDRVRAVAGGLRSLGIQAGERVVIQCENCPEWAWFDWACQSMGYIVVPIYPTLPSDQTQYIVSDCGAKIVIAGDETQAVKTRSMPGIEVVLLPDLIAKAHTPNTALTREEWEVQVDQIDPDSVATFIYTSGTTGVPKGAMLTHSNFTVLCEAVLKQLPINHLDTFFCILPMSHVYERVAGQVLPISCGATICYAQNLRSLASDMEKMKPTIVLCVPRVLNAIRERILDTVAKMPLLRQKLFALAYKQGLDKADGKFAPLFALTDHLIGGTIRSKLGGKIRFLVSGGAAMPLASERFYAAFRIVVLQGYGLTETTAITSVNHPNSNDPTTIGNPISCVETKIADDGEILFRGPSIMKGYHNLPEATAEAIDAEGWFHTGDIGSFEHNRLKITDRKKDLIVLGNGKNVAPQPIENKLGETDFIADAVLFGDGRECISALIVPKYDKLRAKFKDLGLDKATNRELINHPEIKSFFKDEVGKVNQTIADFERVKKYALLEEPFTIEGGDMTPSLKIKRRVVKEKHQATIDAMYS